MKTNFHKLSFGFLFFFMLLLEACTYNHLPESNKTIILNWYPAPAHQTKEEFTTGLVWMFSYLGAKLPANKFDDGVKFISSNKIEIDFEALGFADFAINYFKILVSKIILTIKVN